MILILILIGGMGFGARDLVSKNDTNIIGSIVAGNKVIADIGGDLNIQTLQDHERSKSSDVSFGGSVTIGVGVSASVYGGYNSSDSDYLSAKNQAGILAGDHRFDININGNIPIIFKDPALLAAHTHPNHLPYVSSSGLVRLPPHSTFKYFGHTSLIGAANYDASSMGMSVGFSKGGSNKVDANTGNLSANGTGTASSWGNLNSARPSFMTASDSSNSQTKSGISAGNITITNAENQAKLTGKTPEEMLALLNRDVLTGWDKTNALDKIYDEASIKASFEITNQLNTEVGIYQANRAAERAKNEKTIKDLEEKAKSGALSDAQIAELNKAKASLQSSEKWAMGGTSTLALNAISLAANGNVTGSAADLIRDSAVNYLQGLAAQEIKKLGDQFGEAARTALHAIASCAGAAAKQGSSGGSSACGSAALAGGASVVLNNALDNLLKINSKDMDSLEKDARVNLITSLIAGITQAAGGDAALANAASRIEMENNYLKAEEKIRQNVLKNKEKNGTITEAESIELNFSDAIDKTRDAEFIQSCSKSLSPECVKQLKLAQDAKETYQGYAEYNAYYDLREKFPEEMAKYGDLLGEYSRDMINLVGQGYTTNEARDLIAQDQNFAQKYQDSLNNMPSWAAIAMTLQDTVGLVYGSKSANIALNKFQNPNLKVTAELEINGVKFKDTNQTARPDHLRDPNSPTLISDQILKKQRPGRELPNGNMGDAHAEIGAIQQAHNAGLSKGADMKMTVTGKDVCGFCQGDIAKMAKAAGINSLTIQAVRDGKPITYYWQSGMRSIKEQ